MLRTTTLLLTLVLILFTAPILPQEAARAQASPDGFTTYQLNMRTGPGTRYDVIVMLDSGTDLFFEARTADLTWLLARTTDGVYRGWVATLYVGYHAGFGSPSHLPTSDEIIAHQPPPAPDPNPAANPDPAAPAPAPAGGAVAGLDDATVALLRSVPVVPGIGSSVYTIYARGQALGNNPRVFTQVGECNIMSQAFMVPFASGAYNLGPYEYLQATINFFGSTPVQNAANSFWYKGAAMTTGLTSAAVVDPAYSDPALCPGGQSLLACEYERSKPAVALIHLGLYDVYWLSPAQYEASMRQILNISIEYGVIPVLTTFPTYPGDESNWPNDAAQRYQNRAAFNRSVIQLGREYGVPVVNLWLATEPLTWHGLVPGDHQHLADTWTGNHFVNLDGEETHFGFTMWNLIALQTLDALRTSVLGG